ncbi:Late control protein D [Fusobacterium necrophorum subsp. funduliforme]|uniref:phage late control D family protein n=1 Tax=Fusobacterium necrophorum TaxID=859 RepID=UPI000AB39F9A|nr:hypothetical protein [Fusobacterium necrophorum]
MDKLTRRAFVNVFYAGKDISLSLQQYMTGFSIIDNANSTIDSIEFSLRNDGNRFLKKEWDFPKKARFDVKLTTINWEKENEGMKERALGSFYIDDKNYSKEKITIKGLSIPLGNIQDQKNSKHWEKISLKKLGEEIAKKYNLKYLFLAKEEKGAEFKSLNQDKETDLGFLSKVCEEEGMNLKITFDKLVIFDEEVYENKPIVRVINLEKTEVLSWDIRNKSKEIYDAVLLVFSNSKKGKEEKYFYSITGKKEKEEGQKILKINRRGSGHNLEKYAKKALKRANKEEIELTLNIIGELSFSASSCFLLENAGMYNGKYYIKQVKRSLEPFVTSISCYRIGGEYGIS